MKLMHMPQAPWLLSSDPEVFTVRLWVSLQEYTSVTLYFSDSYDYLPEPGKRLNWTGSSMNLLSTTSDYEVWSVGIPVPTHKICYRFLVSDGSRDPLWYGPNGLSAQAGSVGCFRTGYRFPEDTLPSWTGKSAWYQIFPDRFAGGDPDQLFLPGTENFWGGTLEGIIEKIPCLKQLGVTGIYLNPVFSSPSNHRYDTLDYLQVDPRLGSSDSLFRLSKEVHRNGLKLMLDGVFNHCSDRSPFFGDVKSHGKASPYYDWFIIHDPEETMRIPTERLTAERMKADSPYECFAFAANMPKWNTDHPGVQNYLIGAAEYWTKMLDLDAWRLDVPDEVSPSFLRAFRRRIKQLSPDILILGEIWTDPCPWVQTGLFDGTMDYPLHTALSQFMLTGEMDARTFCDALNRRQGLMTEGMMKNQMLFLGNHDLPRCLTVANGNLEKVKAAWLLLCMMDGEVNLYYGDENAMTGGEDPANRGVMVWEEEPLRQEMRSFVRESLQLRAQILSEGLQSVQFQALSMTSVLIQFRRSKETISFLFDQKGSFPSDICPMKAKMLRKGDLFCLWAES